jgi:hypothetical protein
MYSRFIKLFIYTISALKGAHYVLSPIACIWWETPLSWWHPAALWTWNSPGSLGTYTCGLNFTGVYCICNCILHRNYSALRIFLCVWLAFVLTLIIFHRPKAETCCLTSFLPKKEKRLQGASIFFSHKKAHLTTSFCLRRMKQCQHQHESKPHTDGTNLRGVHFLKRMQL